MLPACVSPSRIGRVYRTASAARWATGFDLPASGSSECAARISADWPADSRNAGPRNGVVPCEVLVDAPHEFEVFGSIHGQRPRYNLDRRHAQSLNTSAP
jgi:hypothetical protein